MNPYSNQNFGSDNPGMAGQHQDVSAANRENEESIKFQDIFALCLKNWLWIAISLVICVTLGVLYLMRTQPEYTRSASLLIKNDRKGSSSMSSDANAFSNMGLFVSNTNVYNELISIQSPDVISIVVQRLHLDMNYSVKHGLRHTSLYGKTLPVKVDFFDLEENETARFLLTEETDGSISLNNFVHKGKKVQGNVTGHYYDTLETPVGKLMVQMTPNHKSDEMEPILVSRAGVHRSTQSCMKRLSVNMASKESTILELVYEDPSIERGDDFLSTLIAVNNEKWLLDKNQVAVATSMFINERLAVIEQELGNVDSDISSYKSEHLIPDVQAASNLYMNQANEAEAQILELNTKLYMARYVKEFIEESRGDFQLLPANSGIDAASIEKQISEYNSKVLERNSLALNSSESNPLVIDLDNSIAAMREAILVSVDNQINSLNAQIESFRSSEQQNTSRIASNPSQAKYLLSVERQQKVKESLYIFLLQKREENELSQAFTADNTRIIKHPTGPMLPSSPSAPKILILAFILGLGLPIGCIVLMEMLDTRVRGRKDLEWMSIPFVGEIPQMGKTTDTGAFRRVNLDNIAAPPTLMVQKHNRNIINEAFRVVRSNLEFMMGMDENNKLMMVTSCNPHSGKTFVALNLGATYVLKGRKTLLVDLDLRRASLSKVVGKPSKGISTVLSGKLDDWRKAVIEVEGSDGLQMLPVGALPPNPSELLYSKKLETIFNEMRQEYDVIILDCAPVELVADTSIIAKYADITAFIIRIGLLERDMLSQIQNYYDTGRFKNMALMLNFSKSGGKYGYRYGYHYGYGSGYGSSEES